MHTNEDLAHALQNEVSRILLSLGKEQDRYMPATDYDMKDAKP
jgi:hypothetical protein